MFELLLPGFLSLLWASFLLKKEPVAPCHSGGLSVPSHPLFPISSVNRIRFLIFIPTATLSWRILGPCRSSHVTVRRLLGKGN